MRGTTKITNNNSLYYINRNYELWNKTASQLAMEQQVVDLEDNPLSANIGIRMQNAISKTNQYNKNVKAAIASLSLTDGYLRSSKTVMDKIKTTAIAGATDSTTQEQRKAHAIELNEIFRQLVSSANAYDGGRYIFGGQQTTTPPFTIVNGRYVNYVGNDKLINVNIGSQATTAINCTGSSAFGTMVTTLSSRDFNPDVNLVTDHSTVLSDLNDGKGVPKGKITVYYSSYPNGLEVDLSGCDSLEDVKDQIEQQTLAASKALNTADHQWLNKNNLNWHDLQDRYVRVTMNPDHNGISLQEIDLGEPLPEPTASELRKGLSYDGSGNPNYAVGGSGVGAGKICDKPDYVYGGGSAYAPLKVEDYANNGVAEALGIKGTATKYDLSDADKVVNGFIHGRDLNPTLSNQTLRADLEGYHDSVFTFYNGAKPGSIVISESSQDANNVFNNWDITGLSKGDNTGPNGELYARAVNRGTAAAPDIQVEIYTVPIDKAKASDLVATGTYTQSSAGGTVNLKEANSSGIGGSVGIILPASSKEAKVSLQVDFGEVLTGAVHVPAFVEEQNTDGTPRDVFNIASGWNIRGLDKPPATGYDLNHPASTDLNGDVSVNYRYDSANNQFVVELFRPAYNDQPAKLIASGTMAVPNSFPTSGVNSGRVQLVGAEGFEGVSGSVYLEIPSGTSFSGNTAVWGADANNPTQVTYRLQSDASAGSIFFNGSTELAADQAIQGGAYFSLKGDTLFKKGQVFDQDVKLPSGGFIAAGTALSEDMVIPKGVQVSASSLKAGTVLSAGQEVNFTQPLAAGTVIPRGSYYTSGGAGVGFPSGGMSMSVTVVTDASTGATSTRTAEPMGYNVTATFATVEDFNRAVEERGIYVTSRVADDGKSLEFISHLAGAYLTVSEDTDCYEQMGDVNQQLSSLDLSGLVKGVSADKNGNVYTEVIYYPPDSSDPTAKVKLVSDEGKIYEVDPGYYVRVYSDPDEMNKSYENRDNTKMVAEGFLAAGQWNPTPANPTDPNSTDIFIPIGSNGPVGVMQNLVLEERNSSGVRGTVDLDYHGDRGQFTVETVTNPDGSTSTETNYNPWGNDGITVFPGGLRPVGAKHATIQEWDMYKITPGITCDYTGTYHGTIAKDSSTAAGLNISLYKDSSKSVMTARNNPAEPIVDGKVNLYEVDKYGRLATDANGDYIPAGTMTVAGETLQDGQSDSFTLTTGGLRSYGQERESNVFATINDLIDALNLNDVETLHDLVGSVGADITRILGAIGDVGARGERLEVVYERYADDILNFKSVITSRVGMDAQALSMAVLDNKAAVQALEAAMQVSSTIMQMSLLNYL